MPIPIVPNGVKLAAQAACVGGAPRSVGAAPFRAIEDMIAIVLRYIVLRYIVLREPLINPASMAQWCH